MGCQDNLRQVVKEDLPEEMILERCESSSHEATSGKRVRVAKRGETSPCKGPGAEAKGMRELVGNEIRKLSGAR